EHIRFRLFRLAVPQWFDHDPVSTPRSSNRTCRFLASGSRTRISRLRPRHVAPERGEAYEPEVPVKVREWIGPALASPDFMLDAQPPTQPHRCVAVDRPICFVDGAYLEVVRPSTQRAVQLAHQLRSEEHTSELQSRGHLVCRLLLEKKKKNISR